MSRKSDRFRDHDQTEDFSTRRPSADPVTTTPLPTGQAARRRLRNAAHIQIEQIVVEEQVRDEFDPEELERLAHSLKTKGQLQPVRVRWSDERGLYVIIMGERRFRAAQLAGFAELECIIHDAPLSETEIHELQLIENLIRQDLNPIEEAKGYKKIMTDRTCTAKTLAPELGLNPSTVQRSVRLLALPDDIQQQIASGQLPKSVVREIQKLRSEEQQRQMIATYLQGSSYAEIAGQVKQKKRGKSATGPLTRKTFHKQGITIQITSKRQVSDSEIATVIRLCLDDLENDDPSHTGDTAA